MPRPLRAAAPLAIALLLAACAEAPPPAAPAQPPPPGVFDKSVPREISPVDQEMLSIARSEEEIDRLFPEARPPVGPRKGGKGAPPPADTGKTAVDKPGATAEPRAPASGDACTVACKALASMVSSAERLCRLAGDNDGRCDDARARVNGARARVKASCPACNASPAPMAPSGPSKGTPVPAPSGPAPGMPGSSSIPIP
jgi:hypothetical protein